MWRAPFFSVLSIKALSLSSNHAVFFTLRKAKAYFAARRQMRLIFPQNKRVYAFGNQTIDHSIVMSVNHITRTQINIGERIVPLVARVNRRAKRLIIKVDPVAGEILVTAPSKRTMPEAIRFANERADWIAGQLNDDLRGKPFVEGIKIPFCGVDHLIINSGGLRAPVKVDRDYLPTIRVGGDPTHINRRLTDWLKNQARRKLSERADYYCERLGKKRGPLKIRDTRTRWGSCSSDGTLSFSWRLVLAPPSILEYVAAHECVHLVHMDHSPAFWRQLATLDVDARAAADWFDTHGPTLFSYGASA